MDSRTQPAAPNSVCPPAFVAGHAVHHPGLLSMGAAGQFAVYAAGVSLVGFMSTTTSPHKHVDIADEVSRRNCATVCSDEQKRTVVDASQQLGSKTESKPVTSTTVAVQPNSLGSNFRFAFLEHAEQECISCLCAHPEKTLVCVGTTQHGVYLTDTTEPVFDRTTRLPMSITNTHIFSACFMQATNTAGVTGDLTSRCDAGEDVIVFSSGSSAALADRLSCRLSLWHVQHKCLLWRGMTEPMYALCAFPNEMAFVATTHREMCYFTVSTTHVSKGSHMICRSHAGGALMQDGATAASMHASGTDSVQNSETSTNNEYCCRDNSNHCHGAGSIDGKTSSACGDDHDDEVGGTSGRHRLRVSLCRCTSVDDLNGSRYVHCVIPPPRYPCSAVTGSSHTPLHHRHHYGKAAAELAVGEKMQTHMRDGVRSSVEYRDTKRSNRDNCHGDSNIPSSANCHACPDHTRDCSTEKDAQRASHEGADNSVFFALTAAGLLVAFDRHTGSVLRWMNCKLATATALCVSGDTLLVMGDVMRVFGSASWEVQGKVRPGGNECMSGGQKSNTRLHTCMNQDGCGIAKRRSSATYCAAAVLSVNTCNSSTFTCAAPTSSSALSTRDRAMQILLFDNNGALSLVEATCVTGCVPRRHTESHTRSHLASPHSPHSHSDSTETSLSGTMTTSRLRLRAHPVWQPLMMGSGGAVSCGCTDDDTRCAGANPSRSSPAALSHADDEMHNEENEQDEWLWVMPPPRPHPPHCSRSCIAVLDEREDKMLELGPDEVHSMWCLYNPSIGLQLRAHEVTTPRTSILSTRSTAAARKTSLAAAVPLSSRCAAWHAGTHTLLVYTPATREVLAYSSNDGWRLWTQLELALPPGRALRTLCCAPSGPLCAALDDANTVYYFSCAWCDPSEMKRDIEVRGSQGAEGDHSNSHAHGMPVDRSNDHSSETNMSNVSSSSHNSRPNAPTATAASTTIRLTCNEDTVWGYDDRRHGRSLRLTPEGEQVFDSSLPASASSGMKRLYFLDGRALYGCTDVDLINLDTGRTTHVGASVRAACATGGGGTHGAMLLAGDACYALSSATHTLRGVHAINACFDRPRRHARDEMTASAGVRRAATTTKRTSAIHTGACIRGEDALCPRERLCGMSYNTANDMLAVYSHYRVVLYRVATETVLCTVDLFSSLCRTGVVSKEDNNDVTRCRRLCAATLCVHSDDVCLMTCDAHGVVAVYDTVRLMACAKKNGAAGQKNACRTEAAAAYVPLVEANDAIRVPHKDNDTAEAADSSDNSSSAMHEEDAIADNYNSPATSKKTGNCPHSTFTSTTSRNCRILDGERPDCAQGDVGNKDCGGGHNGSSTNDCNASDRDGARDDSGAACSSDIVSSLHTVAPTNSTRRRRGESGHSPHPTRRAVSACAPTSRELSDQLIALSSLFHTPTSDDLSKDTCDSALTRSRGRPRWRHSVDARRSTIHILSGQQSSSANDEARTAVTTPQDEVAATTPRAVSRPPLCPVACAVPSESKGSAAVHTVRNSQCRRFVRVSSTSPGRSASVTVFCDAHVEKENEQDLQLGVPRRARSAELWSRSRGLTHRRGSNQGNNTFGCAGNTAEEMKEMARINHRLSCTAGDEQDDSDDATARLRRRKARITANGAGSVVAWSMEESSDDVDTDKRGAEKCARNPGSGGNMAGSNTTAHTSLATSVVVSQPELSQRSPERVEPHRLSSARATQASPVTRAGAVEEKLCGADATHAGVTDPAKRFTHDNTISNLVSGSFCRECNVEQVCDGGQTAKQSGINEHGASAALLAQSRHLRQSLLRWTEALRCCSHGRNRDDDKAVDMQSSVGSDAVKVDELAELEVQHISLLLSDALGLVQVRQSRHSSELVTAMSSVSSEQVMLESLMEEMMQIQQQNARLEQQNKAILQRLNDASDTALH